MKYFVPSKTFWVVFCATPYQHRPSSISVRPGCAGVVVLRSLSFSQLLKILDLLPTDVAVQRSIILVLASAFELFCSCFRHAGLAYMGLSSSPRRDASSMRGFFGGDSSSESAVRSMGGFFFLGCVCVRAAAAPTVARAATAAAAGRPRRWRARGTGAGAAGRDA